MKKNLYIPLSLILISLTAIAGIFWYTLKITNPQNTNQQISNIQTPVGIEDNATPEQIHITSDIEEFSEEDLEEIDTSNWQTYRNEEYGFEFRYPEEWVVEEDEYKIVVNSSNYKMGFAVIIEKTSKSLEEFITDYNSIDKISRIISQKQIFLRNTTAIKLVASTAIGIEDVYLYLNLNKNNRYLIKYNEFLTMHNAIISSFLIED